MGVKFLNQMKQKIVQDYERKSKQVETQHAIARSSAINKSRLEKIKSRQEMIGKIADDTKKHLAQVLASEANAKPFVRNLIVQGLLMLLEEKVEVRCRAVDNQLVESCLQEAAAEYSKVVKQETGATKKVELTLDTQVKLPPARSGARAGQAENQGVAVRKVSAPLRWRRLNR